MVYIIAEAGVNHNGKLDLALQLVDIAKESGADAIKFQTFKANKLASKEADKAKYQKETTDSSESQVDMLKRLELSYDEFKKVKDYCTEKKIEFISTPFDLESADFLNELNVNTYKIGSGDLTNYPLLRKVAKTGKKLILSTGMSNMDEVEDNEEILKVEELGEVPDIKKDNNDLIIDNNHVVLNNDLNSLTYGDLMKKAKEICKQNKQNCFCFFFGCVWRRCPNAYSRKPWSMFANFTIWCK